MSLTDELERLIAAEGPRVEAEPEYARLARFLQEMKDRDLVRPQEYGLPLVDTVGASLARPRDREPE
jgi:hypothetical protein